MTVPALKLDAPGAATFEVDQTARTISGLAVPYGVVATSYGEAYRFHPGSLRWSDTKRVKLFLQHDANRAVGYATTLEDREATDTTPAGLFASFKVATGPAGDEALTMAAEGVWDGLSIGTAAGGRFTTDDNGVHDAVEVPLMEISLTPAPAFDDARVHQVAASATTNTTHRMGDTTVDTTTTDQAAAPAAPDFAALTTGISSAIREGFGAVAALPPRQTVGAGAATTVREELPYRFNGGPGAHSFGADLQAMSSGDSDARQRLERFMGEAFAVDTSNVTALNPAVNRPELYVPNLTYTRPLWESVSTGTVDDRTPFTVPKFSSATGLVDDHVQGTEPTPGTFAATSQTITPGPISGKLEITREVWDQGGSPQADAIMWGEMLNAWFESLEVRVADFLDALTLSPTELNLAGAVDAALITTLKTSLLVPLQFARGGNRFTSWVLDGNLFGALVDAKDDMGRQLLPVLGPSNADGSVSEGFDRVQLGNLTGRAAWALGSAVDSHSYLMVPGSVWAWASAPQRFTFEHQIKSIDLGIWGYAATACTRASDVKRIDYTTADS